MRSRWMAYPCLMIDGGNEPSRYFKIVCVSKQSVSVGRCLPAIGIPLPVAVYIHSSNTAYSQRIAYCFHEVDVCYMPRFAF